MKINENKFDWFFLFNTLKGFFIEHIETVFLKLYSDFLFMEVFYFENHKKIVLNDFNES